MRTGSTDATRSRRRALASLLGLLGLLVPALPAARADATSVRAVGVRQMLEASALVFEGRVLSLRVERDDRERPWTCARFEVLEVIRGTSPRRSLELCFLGGRIGSRGLRIGEMRYPAVGEHGVYFVEDPERRQVNPIYGWSQGHFVVVTDAEHPEGVVRTADGRRVVRVRAGDAGSPGLSNGIARGLELAREGDESGLTGAEFKARLRELAPESTP